MAQSRTFGTPSHSEQIIYIRVLSGITCNWPNAKSTLLTMADHTISSNLSPLNPNAPTFNMPFPTPKTNGNESHVTDSQPNGDSKSKSSKASKTPAVSAPSKDKPAETSSSAKAAALEAKKQKAAEKALRRAEKLEARPEAPKQPQDLKQRRPSQSGRQESGGQPTAPHHKRTGSTSTKALPIRAPAQKQDQVMVPPPEKQDEKRVPMFSHLYSRTPRASIATAGREIHPSILTLGLQLRDYVICGSNARLVATLLAFKKVIQSYTTPASVALSRHLTTHLSHQISYINQARSLSTSQGNAIRWLKKLISALDPECPENEAKGYLCEQIDGFVREKVTLADEVIAREAGGRIEDGDVILTYGKSSVVQKTLVEAKRAGRRFSVVVVDARPLFEGKNLVGMLVREGVKTQYCLLSGLADVVDDVTKCFLGAAAMLGNGALSARAGTAMTAMMVKECCNGRRVPVMVLCESVKFTSKVALDGVVMNELADPDALIEEEEAKVFTTEVVEKKDDKPGKKKGKDDDSEEKVQRGLEGWRDKPNLYVLSLMYDVTPAEYLDMVISEQGSLPPSSVPVVNGVQGGDE